MKQTEGVLCPVCGSKTRNRIREDTVLISGVAYSGQAYPANYPAENAGLFHKGNCPACGIDNGCYLCKARPSAEKAAEDFIII